MLMPRVPRERGVRREACGKDCFEKKRKEGKPGKNAWNTYLSMNASLMTRTVIEAGGDRGRIRRIERTPKTAHRAVGHSSSRMTYTRLPSARPPSFSNQKGTMAPSSCTTLSPVEYIAVRDKHGVPHSPAGTGLKLTDLDIWRRLCAVHRWNHNEY